MGRTIKRSNSVADNGPVVSNVIIALDEGKGKFPEKVESEIADIRERMKSSRQTWGFSPKGISIGDTLPKDGLEATGSVPESVAENNEIGSFSPPIPSASTQEVSEPAALSTSNGEGGGGAGGWISRRSTFDMSKLFGLIPEFPAAKSSAGANAVVSSTPDENRRKLRALAQKAKWALAQKGKWSDGTAELDEAFHEFADVSDHCGALCTALVQFEVKRRLELHERMRKNGSDETLSNVELVKALEKAPSLMEVREWRDTVAGLTARLLARNPAATTSELSEAPSEEARAAAAETGNGLYHQQHVRAKESLGYLTQLLEFPNSGHLPELTIKRFEGLKLNENGPVKVSVPRQDDTVLPEIETPQVPDLTAMDIDVPELGDTTPQEFDISRRGDAILEFSVALGGMADDSWPLGAPAPRKASFRVSSHFLSETSTVFSQLFSGRSPEHSSRGAFPRPRPGVARDGRRVNIFRMSPILPGEIRPLQIFLYAAHMHNDKIPRGIGFDDFVAISKICLRFQCTAPLELVVEMCWLPEWMHMTTEAVPEGLVLITYAFGNRGIFTRVTKSAILNIVDEVDLEGRRWPQELKEKIWAVRQAKMEQLYACCVATIQEYLRPPRAPLGSSAVIDGRPRSIFQLDEEEAVTARVSSPTPAQTGQSLFPYLLSTSTPPAGDTGFPTSTPRCPKGSHACDAANLGYFMIVLAELQLLPTVLNQNALAQAPRSPGATAAPPQSFPPRSLAQLVKILQRIPSPPNPIHRGGVCDPIPAFRHAVIDIFNSLSGITLYEVTGKHGYGMSRKHAKTPQRVRSMGIAVGGVGARGPRAEVPERAALGMLRAAESLADVRALAMTSRRFYDTYRRHEVSLIAGLGVAAAPPPPREEPAGCDSPSFEVLTEEEARRIIWPDSPAPPSSPPPFPAESGALSDPPPLDIGGADGTLSDPTPLDIGRAEPEGSREKFRAEDALFTEGKVLSVVETKQLTVEHDVVVGMRRDKVEVEGA